MTSIATDYSRFSHTTYGKGHLVMPSDDYQFNESSKYFHGGFWMPKKQGWFFRDEDFQKFKPLLSSKSRSKKNFAKTTIDEVHHGLKKQQPMKSKDLPLTHYLYYPYGKGYLLYIDHNYQHMVEFPDDYKCFHGAWWMEPHNAWFFKSDIIYDIMAKGAKIDNEYLLQQTETMEDYEGTTTDEETTTTFDEETTNTFDEETSATFDDPKDTDYDSMNEDDEDDEEEDDDWVDDRHDLRKWVTTYHYGRGWLVIPNNGYKYYGEKYFHGGWWMPSQNGWFFRENEFAALGL